MEEKKFLDEVLGHIPRATWWEKREIRAELAGHLEDHALGLEERGCSTEEAREQAVNAMGDPGEIGEALNAQLSTFWLTVQGLVQGAMAILLILILWQVDWLEPFRLIQQNWTARRGEDLWGIHVYEDPYLCWNSGEEMTVGDSVVRLEVVTVNPYVSSEEKYLCDLTLCTYREQAWKPAQDEIFQRIWVIPEGEAAVKAGTWQSMEKWGSSKGCYQFVMPADSTYVDVVYDYLGEHVEMRCEIQWEEQVWDGEES